MHHNQSNFQQRRSMLGSHSPSLEQLPLYSNKSSEVGILICVQAADWISRGFTALIICPDSRARLRLPGLPKRQPSTSQNSQRRHRWRYGRRLTGPPCFKPRRSRASYVHVMQCLVTPTLRVRYLVATCLVSVQARLFRPGRM